MCSNISNDYHGWLLQHETPSAEEKLFVHRKDRNEKLFCCCSSWLVSYRFHTMFLFQKYYKYCYTSLTKIVIWLSQIATDTCLWKDFFTVPFIYINWLAPSSITGMLSSDFDFCSRPSNYEKSTLLSGEWPCKMIMSSCRLNCVLVLQIFRRITH